MDETNDGTADVILHDPRRSTTGPGGDSRSHEPTGERPSRGLCSGQVEHIVEEFIGDWQRGDRLPTEVYLERHPVLRLQPAAAIRVIYEEVCLRRAEGQVVPLSELARRFPSWRAELEVLLDCDRLLGAIPGPPSFPRVGETLGEFELVAELGRGARGRCFLAVQSSLSDRPVVLKVTPDDHVEHLSLARLQHTHIMPLYSEQSYPSRRLRALCMPYLGSTTLARLLATLGDTPISGRSGRSVLDALDRAPQPGPCLPSASSPARRFLAQSTYVGAVCWIGACLADALQYAHDRGLIHLDIKPSNILLTDDCQPMLLDFHLARAPIPVDDPSPEGVGGTPGYMSPEQEHLVAAPALDRVVHRGIDARSDLYSLGRVLAEMLGGVDPRAPGAGPMRPLRFGSPVSTGLADILRKCLATDAAERYPHAAALAEDLRRHMGDLPLRGVSNRDLRERWTKWCRRQPCELFRFKTLLAGGGALVAAIAVIWLTFLAPRFRDAADALAEGRVLLDRHDHREAARVLNRAAALIEDLPGGGWLAREVAGALAQADRLEEADRLHRLVDRLRFADSAADRPTDTARDVERRCRALWASRRTLLEHWRASPDPRVERAIRDDLLDLAVIESRLLVRLETDPRRADLAHRAALALLDDAEASLGPSHVLYQARRAHATALGLTELARAARRRADDVPPRTAWEYDAAGRVQLASDDLAGAAAAFERALEIAPHEFWPSFHHGICAFRRGRYQDALTAFTVCVALKPDEAECFHNRALALAALGHPAQASRDHARAVALDPTLAATSRDRRPTAGQVPTARPPKP